MSPDERSLIMKVEEEVVCALLNSETFKALLKGAQELNLGILKDISVVMTFEKEIPSNLIDEVIPEPNPQDKKILKALKILW